MSENHREPEVPQESPSGRMSRWPCKDYLRGTCNKTLCEKWHPPECLFYKTKSGCRFGEKCSYAHRQVDAQPTKWSKSNNDKSAVALLKKGDWHERGSVPDRNHDRSGIKFQRLQTFSSYRECHLQGQSRWSVMHFSKHSLFSHSQDHGRLPAVHISKHSHENLHTCWTPWSALQKKRGCGHVHPC